MTRAAGLRPGTVCLVTGASRGLGLAITGELVTRGARVIGIARDAERLQRAFARFGDRVLGLPLDVTDAAAVGGLLDRLPPPWREVEVLIANAGSDVGGRQPFVEGDVQDWTATVETNVNGVIRICHALLPGMARREAGHLVVLGSNAGLAVYAGGAVYCASKHAVRAFADALRLEYRNAPLRITEVLPGLTRTGFAEARYHGDRARADAFYDAAPATLDPEDVAAAVIFALEQPAHVNVGQLLITPTLNK